LPDPCLVVLVTVPDHLSVIMLHVYFVTLPGPCYTFCGGILLMYLHYIYSVFCISCRHHYCYAQHRIVVVLHMPTCMFTSITSPLDDYRHDPMITGLVMVLKDDMYIYFYCLHVYLFLLLMIFFLYGIMLTISLLYGITSTTTCII